MNQKVDYFIVGLGLAGSALAWELLERGKKILVFDQPEKNLASSVAAGLFNPVTGKLLAKTWKADIIFPFLKEFYTRAQCTLGRNFFYELPIYRPFNSDEEREMWKKKSANLDANEFIKGFYDTAVFENQIHNPFGGMEITRSGYLDVPTWIVAMQDFLRGKESYAEQEIRDEDLHIGNVVSWNGWTADKIIFCNGMHSKNNRWFSYLPVLPLKGEILTVQMDVHLERIYNRGVYIVPGIEKNRYTVGSTYLRPPFKDHESKEALEELESKLQALTVHPFKTIHQRWGIRPTTPDRRPLLGSHPNHQNIVIFNGLGTKGVSLAPYFAKHLVDWLQGSGDILPEVNINRFKALYSS